MSKTTQGELNAAAILHRERIRAMTDKPGGVLAVLDEVIEGMGGPTDLGLSKARAKVAELLAAAESLEHGVSAEKLVRLSDAIRAMRGDT